MPSTALLDRDRLEAIVSAISNELDGEWLLVGGAMAALWLSDRRATEDVDIIGLGGTVNERLALMDLATKLGLPVEVMNSAADYFVRRVPGWRNELVLFRQGTRGKVYRPSPTLFVLLKMSRLSEQDLADCLAAIARARLDQEKLDRERLLSALTQLAPTQDNDVAARRYALSSALL